MKNMFKLLYILFLTILSLNYTNAQPAKSNLALSEAQKNKTELQLELPNNVFEVIKKNHETYYKEFLTLNVNSNSSNSTIVTIIAIQPENNRIIKRLLITSDIREIQFKDKKVSIDEFFGF